MAGPDTDRVSFRTQHGLCRLSAYAYLLTRLPSGSPLTLVSFIRHAYYLSIPVVLGAVFSNRMAARLSDVEPVHWATPVVLALVVFIIYTVDRLLDVRKAGQPATARHAFHRRHAPLLWRVVAGAAGLAFVLTFFLPRSVIAFGVGLGLVCGAYVGAVYRLPARHPALLLKEPLVALLYSVGVWGSVWVQRAAISGIDLTEFGMFVGIAFQNLILFALMERHEHPDRSPFSVATAWGDERCNRLLRGLTLGLTATGLLICFVTDDRFAQRAALILALMSLALYGIGRHPGYFLKNERYRWLGDGVFWMPALVL